MAVLSEQEKQRIAEQQKLYTDPAYAEFILLLMKDGGYGEMDLITKHIFVGNVADTQALHDAGKNAPSDVYRNIVENAPFKRNKK